MAGNGAKLAGALLFTFGAILILVGGATIALAVDDQADNEQSGPLGAGEDQDRTQRNMAGVGGAIAAMIVGAIFAIGGIVAIAVGIGQRTGELRDVLHQQQSVVVTDGDAAALQQQQTALGTAMPRGGIIALALVGALLLTGVVVTAFGIGPIAEPLGLDGAPDNLIDTREEPRSMPAMATLLGSSQSPASTSHALSVPAGTGRIGALLNWTPVMGGAAEIQFSIEYLDGETWRQLGQVAGGPGIALEVDDTLVPGGRLADHELRYRAFSGEDGIMQGQDYTVYLAFYRE